MDARDLEPLLERRTAYLSAWQACAPELEDKHLEDISRAFERELERIGESASSRELLDAALEATATCLAKRGVPLASLLAASACSARAAIEAFGGDDPTSLLLALAELEAMRAQAYVRGYDKVSDADRPRCTSPILMKAARPASTATYGIVGASAAIARVRRLVEAAARGPTTILVTGESGSGKELVARAVHAASRAGAFVAINCAALPNHLVESELFGHVRGAFTGAATDHAGLFRAAHGGTLFFDEVTEMSAEIQAKLLRVLEERTVRAVGSLKETTVDVRVVASTNRDPDEAVRAGRLRADLFYRLQSFCIAVPPLRERKDDVPLLVEHFLSSYCHRRCGCIWAVSEAAMGALVAADWPGNVRELRNAIEHAVTTGESGVICVRDLPSRLWDHAPAGERVDAVRHLPSLAEAEMQLIHTTLEHCGGNKLRAAESLGISRHRLYDRLRKSSGS